MDGKAMASELLLAARDLVGGGPEADPIVGRRFAGEGVPDPLSGMTKRAAARYVNKMLDKYGKAGIFRHDTSWRPVKILFDELDREGIRWELKSAKYDISPSARDVGQKVPDNKTWRFEVSFINDRGRINKLYGVVIASGAGPVEDPLDSYDLIAYVS